MENSTNMTKKNFNKVCRACLSDRKNHRYIFATPIPRMMETCADIQVSEKDGLSPYVCVTCSYFLAKFCAFKKRIEHSDQFLRNHLDKYIHKQQDTPDTAVSKAQIMKGNNEEVIKFIKNVNPLVNPLIGRSNEMQLVKPESPVRQTAEIEIAEVKEEIKPEIDLEIYDEIFEHTVVEYVDANSQTFVAEPPPLLLLESTKILDEPEKNPDDFNLNAHLAAKPLPVIPIEPLVTDSINLANSIQIPEIELTPICISCNQHFMSVSALKKHKLTSCRDHHLKGHMIQNHHKCKICNKYYSRQRNLRRHMSTHQVQKSNTNETYDNDLKFISNFVQHRVLNVERESLPFCCIHCGKKFSQEDNMQQHIRSVHGNEKPFVCDKCGKCFGTVQQLNSHTWIHAGHTYNWL